MIVVNKCRLYCPFLSDIPGAGGDTLRKIRWVRWPASQTPYPIYDHNLRFFPTLFMT